MEHEDFRKLVQQQWKNNQGQNIWEQWSENYNNSKSQVSEWSKKTFKKADSEITSLKNRVQDLSNSRHSIQNQKEIDECKKKIEDLWKQEEMFWKSRARIKWLKEGERNSKFFHAVTLQRRAQNRITRIKNADENWIDQEEEILKCFQEYFQNLFTSAGNRNLTNAIEVITPLVSTTMNNELIKNVSMQEVEAAVFGLGASKAPGPDGLNGNFYQKNWEGLKDGILELVKDFFSNAKIPKEINSTYISLIPKVPEAESITQFRPISCCNFIYKVIAKILTNRLQPIMNCLVSENQSAFVAGRQIQDNIVMAHEAFHFILNHYTEASGQMINTMKSGIVFSKGRDFIKRHSAWQVGNGENINMWFDRWLCSNEKIWPLNNVQLDLKVKNLLKDGERKWDEEKIRHLVDLNTARYILATQINETGPDKVIWPYAIDGNYSVKSGYHCAIKDCLSQEEGTSRSREQDSKLWNSIWKAKVQPKVRNFIWKLCKNAIPVRDNLARRKMKVDNQCPICLKKIETTEHCFIFCEKAKAIWFGSLFQWANPNEANLPIADWIEDRILFLSNATEDAERFCAYFFNLLWALWKSRNEFCFKGNKEDPINILARAEVLTNEFLACHNANSNRDSNSSVTDINSDVWSPPSVGVVKINVDAAMEIDKCRGALSVVVRDHKGEVLTGSVKRFPCVSVLQAEGLAVKEAVMMCSALDIKEAIIESDCKLVVDFCNDRYKSWQLETILEGTNELLRSNNGIKVNWISRKKNMVADFWAREAIKNTLCCTWVWCPPVRLRALLLKDKYPKLF
ncbi:putative RNA-directed DNA polymerase [Senna tora]|uniref:Putative RNA-directed DNA polymerase n=1 Tax=Senna tora TaxID=362788 RepID=A0A834SN94_9FABA|nr:putative RNA-directed DNA polymerase [Senna tora]